MSLQLLISDCTCNEICHGCGKLKKINLTDEQTKRTSRRQKTILTHLHGQSIEGDRDRDKSH